MAKKEEQMELVPRYYMVNYKWANTSGNIRQGAILVSATDNTSAEAAARAKLDEGKFWYKITKIEAA